MRILDIPILVLFLCPRACEYIVTATQNFSQHAPFFLVMTKLNKPSYSLSNKQRLRFYEVCSTVFTSDRHGLV